MYLLATLCAFFASTCTTQSFGMEELGPIDHSLMQALETGGLEEIRALITPEKATPDLLEKAVTCKRAGVVRLILNYGVVPKDTTILACAEHCLPTSQNRGEWWFIHLWLHSVKDASENSWWKKIKTCLGELF
jgi:hypothetical protein